MRGGEGGPAIKVDTYFKDVEWLIDTVRLARPDLWRRTDQVEFRRSPLATVIPLAVAVGLWTLLGFSLTRSDGSAWWVTVIVAVFLLASGAFFAVAPLLTPRWVRIEGQTLRLSYLFREEVLAAEQIAEVRPKAVSSLTSRGIIVELLLTDGRIVPLSGLEGGVGELSNTFVSWHQQAMGDTSVRVVAIRPWRRWLRRLGLIRR